MSEPIVYLNNGFVPAAQAKLNIYDLGIALGATLTEMTRTFRISRIALRIMSRGCIAR